MCFAGFSKVCHWGPLIALGIIKIVTWMTLHNISMWWPTTYSLTATINSCTFVLLAWSTLFFFFCALTSGPGFVPLKWKPETEEECEFLQYCHVCEGYKAPRSHHCRKCGRCVKKMDHHCPWINGCVGWANHYDFTLFLLSAVLGCGQATVILVICLYRGIHRNWYLYYGNPREPLVEYTVLTLVTTVLALGLAIGVVLAVGMLLYFQCKSIITNRTAIEDWIEEKANYRIKKDGSTNSFIYPYDLGWKKNMHLVFKRSLQGDGIKWPVRDGCDQYTLTVEQKIQKVTKRERSRVYEIDRKLRGSWFPITAGFNTLIRPPCTDEPRIALNKGDFVTVTRWRKYWLFGEKLDKNLERPTKDRVRGWFPKNAATEVDFDLPEEEHLNSTEQIEGKKKI